MIITNSNKKKDLEKLISQEISIDTTANSELFHVATKSNKNDQAMQRSRRAYSTSPTRSFNQETDERLTKRVSFPDQSKLDDVGNDSSDDSDQSFTSVITTTSSIVDNKVLKRKVVR